MAKSAVIEKISPSPAVIDDKRATFETMQIYAIGVVGSVVISFSLKFEDLSTSSLTSVCFMFSRCLFSSTDRVEFPESGGRR